MSDVRITKDGLKFFEWDGRITKSYVEIAIPSFIRKLRCSVEIDPGVTLGDIFDAVDRDSALKQFLGGYSWCDMDTFHQEAKRPAIKKSDLDYLGISSYFEFGEGMCLNVYGIGKEEHSDANCHYAIDFTPVNELVHLEVKLDPKCMVIAAELLPANLRETEVCYSLLDVLGGIYYEISFHGSPSDRDDKSADLLKAVEEVKSGKAKLVPWEEIKNSSVN